METTQTERREIRRAAGIYRYWAIPVEVVPGDAAPEQIGESWHYVTRGGRRIYHPSAYSKTGWSNMVYRSSTRAVQVGLDWIARNLRGQIVSS